MLKSLTNLSNFLKIKFNDEGLIAQAFIHRSYLNETRKYKFSNERLEFLGDSILSYLVSDYLYLAFPSSSEGHLTNLRSSIVKTSTLAKISIVLSLGEYLNLSKGEEEGGGRHNPSLLADTFEAFLGAVYLDQGLDSVKKILETLLFPLLPAIIKDKLYKDAKSNFQEAVQDSIKNSPLYKVLEEKGPDHAKEFVIGVYVNNKLWGKGTGRNKQIAEQHAAQQALEKWLGK